MARGCNAQGAEGTSTAGEEGKRPLATATAVERRGASTELVGKFVPAAVSGANGSLRNVQGFLEEGDIERVTEVVLEAFEADGLLECFQRLTRTGDCRDHFRKGWEGNYREALRSDGVSALFKKDSSGQWVPVGLIACLPFERWLEAGAPQLQWWGPCVRVPDLPRLQLSDPPEQRRWWYGTTRAILMLAGLQRTLEVLGDRWPAAQHSVYFTAGAVEAAHRRSGLAREAFEAAISGAMSRGALFGWGFTINPVAMLMNGGLRNGNCRIIGTADIFRLAATGVTAASLSADVDLRQLAGKVDPHSGVWHVWVILFDLYGLTGEAFPRCPGSRASLAAAISPSLGSRL